MGCEHSANQGMTSKQRSVSYNLAQPPPTFPKIPKIGFALIFGPKIFFQVVVTKSRPILSDPPPFEPDAQTFSKLIKRSSTSYYLIVTSVTRFGEILPLWHIFSKTFTISECLFSIWQFFNLLCLIFIVVNAPIMQ